MNPEGREKRKDKSKHPLTLEMGLTEVQVELLASRWITTVEGFLGLVSDTATREATMRFLEFESDKFKEIINTCKSVLKKSAASEVLKTPPEKKLGLLVKDEHKAVLERKKRSLGTKPV